MGLWIRSQDKEFLMKIDNINLGLDVDSNEPCRLFTFVGGAVTSFTLGIYNSRERALEVLDEIQNMLKPKLLVKINEFDEQEVHEKIRTNIFYEMPKE